MKEKINSSELSRIMKTLGQCIDTRGLTDKSNIMVISTPDALRFRATNGSVFAEMSVERLGGEEDTFCVDGRMFGKVVSGCSGDVVIETGGRVCAIKGAGRTRLPIVDVNIPEVPEEKGTKVVIQADALRKCYEGVAYAVSGDTTRMALTGVMVEVQQNEMKMVALDGFQLAMCSVPCQGDGFRALVPNSFMKLIANSFMTGDEITLTAGKTRITAESLRDRMSSALLTGDFVDYKRILPEQFGTEVLVKTELIRSALRSAGIVGEKKNTVRMNVSGDTVTLANNGETASFDAEIGCQKQGNDIAIAFDQHYMLNAVGAVDTENAVIRMNTPVTPVVVTGQGNTDVHMLLPVRILN